MSSNVLQSPPIEQPGGSAALSSQTIIFTNGPALTFKTTLSHYLGERLQVPVYGNYMYGSAFTGGKLDDGKRLARYAPMFADAHQGLAAGASVILDGNFGEPVRRAGLWKLARAFHAAVIAIRTACDSPVLLRERARRRAADPTAADHGVTYEDHLSTLKEVLANPLESDPEFSELGVEVVEFRTGTEAHASCGAGARADTQTIATLLNESGLLAPSPTPVTGHRRRHVPACGMRSDTDGTAPRSAASTIPQLPH